MRFLGGFGLVFLLCAALYEFVYVSPAIDEIQTELIAMHQEIKPIPGASLLDEVSYMRNGGEINRIYTTNASPQEIITHYDKEFRRNDWTYIESLTTHDPETNKEARIVKYSKNTQYKYMGYIRCSSESKTINRFIITLESDGIRQH